MTRQMRVFELPLEQILSELQDQLKTGGVETLEQVPAGVWWFKTFESKEQMLELLERTFRQLVDEHLQEIDQS